jgi:hypothetical protein
VITNEYLVKWYLFWDALTRNRTDGALVRLTILIEQNQDVTNADHLMSSFARVVVGELDRFVPN